MRWTTIAGVVALFPAMIAGDYLIKSWPDIVFAYDNIKEVYPAAIAISWFLVVLVLVGFGLWLYTWWLLQEERRAERVAVTTAERAKIKEQLEKETAAITSELDKREKALTLRQQQMVDESNRVLAAATAKEKEYYDRLNATNMMAETVSFQLGQVECALEALTEDHESVLKMYAYLEQWLTKARTSPADFIANVTNGDFDSKRFERCSGKLEKILMRSAEIQQAMQDIKSQHRS